MQDERYVVTQHANLSRPHNTRYVVFDLEDFEVVDDADGHGYKSEQEARIALARIRKSAQGRVERVKCEKCSKAVSPARAVILDISLCMRQYQSGNSGASRRSSVTLCEQCAAVITSNLESLPDSIQALILGRDLPEMAAMKESIELLRQERDDARAQLDMYGGDEGITDMLEELEMLRKAHPSASDK